MSCTLNLIRKPQDTFSCSLKLNTSITEARLGQRVFNLFRALKLETGKILI